MVRFFDIISDVSRSPFIIFSFVLKFKQHDLFSYFFPGINYFPLVKKQIFLSKNKINSLCGFLDFPHFLSNLFYLINFSECKNERFIFNSKGV